MQNTTLDAIGSFHDHISNEIPKILEPWSFSLRIYKRNALYGKLLKEMPDKSEKGGVDGSSKASRGSSNMMYTLRVSYEPHKSVSVVNKGQSIVFNTERDEMLTNGNCSSGFMDDVDSILQKKMKAHWHMFQTIKGEGGNSYEISVGGGEYGPAGGPAVGPNAESDVFVVRSANCFLHGGFKGFLVEVTHLSDSPEASGKGVDKIRWLIREKLGLEKGTWSFSRACDAEDDRMESLGVQYTEALKF